MAKAVPPLSVSTTVCTPAETATDGLLPAKPEGAFEAPAELVAVCPDWGAGEALGVEGLLEGGRDTVAPGPVGLPPATAGRGGNEIRMVSLRKSAGGFAGPGTGGVEGASTAPGTGGITGLGMPRATGTEGLGRAEAPPMLVGTGGFGRLGTLGKAGFGGGVSRMVSFFIPDGG